MTPVVFTALVVALTAWLWTALGTTKIIEGHHGPATLLVVFGVPIMVALFTYDPLIGFLDKRLTSGRDE